MQSGGSVRRDSAATVSVEDGEIVTIVTNEAWHDDHPVLALLSHSLGDANVQRTLQRTVLQCSAPRLL